MNEGVAHRHRGRRGARPATARHRLRRPAHRLDSTRRSPGRARPRRDGRAAVASRSSATPPRSSPSWSRRGERFDVVTDQTSAHDALGGYVPAEIVRRRRRRSCGGTQPDEYVRVARRRRWPPTSGRCSPSSAAGAVVFDYGNNLRAQAQEAGVADAFDYPGFVPAFIRPQFCEGRGPFRWVALSGDPADIARHRPGRPRALPRRRRPPPLDRDGRGARPVPGAAGPDLLARLRASGRRPGWPSTSSSRRGEVSGARSSSGATTSTRAPSPRPTARPRRCATARTRSPTGRSSTPWSTRPPAPRGCRSTTAAGRGSATPSTPGWWSSPTARRWRPSKLERVLTTDPGDGRPAPRRRGLRAGDRGRPRARRPHPDARPR